MTLRGSTPRTQQLRLESVSTQPILDMERALYFTEAYQRHEGTVSKPVLRALALKHYLTHKTLWLGDKELLVGEKGKAPQSAPTFPDLCCHSLEDMRVINSRALIGFSVTEEDLTLQAEKILPYWEERALRNRILEAMTPEWRACYTSGIFTEFMEQRGPGHTVGGNAFYEKGFEAFKADIEAAIAGLDPLKDADFYEKRESLKGMAIACDALMVLGDRYHALALQGAESCQDPSRKAELLAIAENCAVVPRYAPKTYWQALQMYWLVHLAVTLEVNPWDAFSPGRLDQHLIPFYQKDTAAGTLDDAKALELLECLWIKFNNQPAPPKVGITLKESATYTDFANINTGGITPGGEDGVNAVSYLILKCMDEMQLLQPSSNVQISKKNPDAFLKAALAISRKGWGQPAFYNTDAIVQELLNAGKSLADARLGGASGCVETGCFGLEAYILTGYFNLPKILEITLHNGYDPVSQQQLGLALEDFNLDALDFDGLLSSFWCQVEHFLDIKLRGSNVIEAIYAKQMPVPFLSVITGDCIQKALDYNAGGARYNTNYLQGVGIATITDSLSAIQHLVFGDSPTPHLGKPLTLKDFVAVLDQNFQTEGGDLLLSRCRHQVPKYGNDDPRADSLMQQVFEGYYARVTGRPTPRGGQYRINMLPTTCHVYFGEVMLASANGRLAHMPLSEGISPEKGADRHGPTAVIKSCAKMDHLKTGGTLLNQKFAPTAVAGEQGLDIMTGVVRTYFNMDGHHIQFNVIDRETLLAAQADPEGHKDLIVRVAGYSDHFRNLSKALQDEIIGRTEHRKEAL